MLRVPHPRDATRCAARTATRSTRRRLAHQATALWSSVHPNPAPKRPPTAASVAAGCHPAARLDLQPGQSQSIAPGLTQQRVKRDRRATRFGGNRLDVDGGERLDSRTPSGQWAERFAGPARGEIRDCDSPPVAVGSARGAWTARHVWARLVWFPPAAASIRACGCRDRNQARALRGDHAPTGHVS